MIPWADAEWHAMQEEARIWRPRLQQRQSAGDAGTLFLLDGASSSGKSTLVDRLTADPAFLELVPRYCTRERRSDDAGRREYIFIPHESFRERASHGAFIEYRDFQFGM